MHFSLPLRRVFRRCGRHKRSDVLCKFHGTVTTAPLTILQPYFRQLLRLLVLVHGQMKDRICIARKEIGSVTKCLRFRHSMFGQTKIMVLIAQKKKLDFTVFSMPAVERPRLRHSVLMCRKGDITVTNMPFARYLRTLHVLLWPRFLTLTGLK